MPPPLRPSVLRSPDSPDRFGGYRVVRELGRGGMGVVYEAEDEGLGRRVAVKVLSPAAARDAEARQRFLREARVMAGLEHEYIVPVYAIGEEDGRPFFVMPLLAGQPLEARLVTGLSVPEAVEVARQVAEALAAAHEQGLVHRDVKPGNVWLEAHPDGSFKRVRLLDFGLTRGRADVNLTAVGVTVGTPLYMAPEQARGLAVDGRADLFSLGAVLYRMVTGTFPFTGPDAASVLLSVIEHAPPPAAEVNPGVPAGLSELIARLMAKDPHDRPADARQVAEELARFGPAGLGGTGPGRKPRFLSVILGSDSGPTATPARPAAGAGGAEPPEVRAVAWLLGLPGATVDVRTPDGVRPLADPWGVAGAGELVQAIAAPDALGVTDAELALLAPLTRVRGIWLARSGVTDAGVWGLAGLPLARTLTVLGLPHSKVTDAGIDALRYFPGLTALDLTGTAVTVEGLEDLVRVIRDDQVPITRLRLRSIRATRAEVEQLAAFLPDCAIESDFGTFGSKEH